MLEAGQVQDEKLVAEVSILPLPAEQGRMTLSHSFGHSWDSKYDVVAQLIIRIKNRLSIH